MCHVFAAWTCARWWPAPAQAAHHGMQAAARTTRSTLRCATGYVCPHLALQSRDELYAMLGGGQITGAWVAMCQAVAVVPSTRPESSLRPVTLYCTAPANLTHHHLSQVDLAPWPAAAVMARHRVCARPPYALLAAVRAPAPSCGPSGLSCGWRSTAPGMTNRV